MLTKSPKTVERGAGRRDGQALTEENFTKLVSFKSGNLALLAEVLVLCA